MNPINFLNNNTFLYRDKKVFAKGMKEFIALPSKNPVVVSNTNIWSAIKDVFIPISQMYANICNVQFENNLNKEDCVPYDLETDTNDLFLNGRVGDKEFKDPKEMVMELKKYKCVYGFNNLRFDNSILYKYSPNDFIEVKHVDFAVKSLNGVVNLDLYSLIRIDVSRENYDASSVAKSLGFEEQILTYEDSREKKCEQDIRINRFIFEKINAVKIFNIISTLVNCDTTLWQVVLGSSLRKWILINYYLKEGFLPLKKIINSANKDSPNIVKFYKAGFYLNQKYLDISSTYPQTAVNLGDLGIYDDNLFSKFQGEMLLLAKDPELKKYMKGIANSLFGSQFSVNEFWRNEEIFKKVVNTVATKVQAVLDTRKDCVYSNTDCFIVPIDSPDIEIEGYELRKQHEFKELYVFNNNKWVAKQLDGSIQFRGFMRLNSKNPAILKVAREEIIEKLKKANGDDFKEKLDDEKLCNKTIKNLKKYPKEMFQIVIRKESDYCPDISLSMVWSSLQKGWNFLFYSKSGELTTDFKKIDYKYYSYLVDSMKSEFHTEVLG